MPWKTITAMLCITALLSLALLNGINGTLLSVGIAAIAGLGGWAAHKAKNP